MLFLRPIFLVGLIFLGAIGAFVGAVMLMSGLGSGQISLSYDQGGRLVSETISRAADGSRFWRVLGLMGALPLVAGAAAAWFGWRRIRG